MHNDTSISSRLDPARIPSHVAIIMDGNGRWAKARGLDRSQGHQQGVETVHTITEAAITLGVKYLTLYAFSTENWNRPDAEVAALMSLILSSMEESLFMKNNVRLLIIGDTSRLPDGVREAVLRLVERTAGNTGLTEIIALSYSSKWELTEAARAIARDAAAGRLDPDALTEDDIECRLATAGLPHPELLIRTGGELRLSNYLLWQCAYSELYFCDTYWPDFGREDFCRAILDYQQRERRFGKTSEQVADGALGIAL
ncbi:MAG: isoprenyl transferase [Bacteroidaceae bacterium]|nr:isoprenyl transferase [Bacteroidaceae bacterium]